MKIYKACEPNTKILIKPEREPIEGEWSQTTKSNNDKYIKYSQYRATTITPAVTIHKLSSVAVKVNAAKTKLSFSNDFIADVGDTVEITGILTGGSLVTYPGEALKLPIVRYADDRPTDDEVYFTTTIIRGNVVATGSFPRSGNWIITSSRANRSIKRANVGWEISGDDLGFIV